MADHLRSVIDALSPEDQAEVASFMAFVTDPTADTLADAVVAQESAITASQGLRFEWGPADAP